MRSMVEIIGQLQLAVADIKDLNYGGCGAFAYYAGLRLERAGYRVGVKCLGWGDSLPNLDVVRRSHGDGRTASSWGKAGLQLNHLIVECDDWWFDSEDSLRVGARPTFGCWRPQEGLLTLDELYPMVVDPAGWNTMFDRGQLPMLRRAIEAVDF